MRTLKTSEAAALLNVSPNTLRAWEQRFGYPRPQRSPGRHRLYAFAEIDALRGALQEGLSPSSAVSIAQESVTTDVVALVRALTSFKASRADAVMEASLAMASLEQAVEALLLQALETLLDRKGTGSASWEFAQSWGMDWLRRAQRLVTAPEQQGAALIGEATNGSRDSSAVRVRALELFCARGGVEPLVLPVHALAALHEAIAAVRPDVLVVAGSGSDNDVGRWIYGVRSVTAGTPVAYFMRPRPCRGVSSGTWLARSPCEAQRELGRLVAASQGRSTGGVAAPELRRARIAGQASGHHERDELVATARTALELGDQLR